MTKAAKIVQRRIDTMTREDSAEGGGGGRREGEERMGGEGKRSKTSREVILDV